MTLSNKLAAYFAMAPIIAKDKAINQADKLFTGQRTQAMRQYGSAKDVPVENEALDERVAARERTREGLKVILGFVPVRTTYVTERNNMTLRQRFEMAKWQLSRAKDAVVNTTDRSLTAYGTATSHLVDRESPQWAENRIADRNAKRLAHKPV